MDSCSEEKDHNRTREPSVIGEDDRSSAVGVIVRNRFLADSMSKKPRILDMIFSSKSRKLRTGFGEYLLMDRGVHTFHRKLEAAGADFSFELGHLLPTGLSSSSPPESDDSDSAESVLSLRPPFH